VHGPKGVSWEPPGAALVHSVFATLEVVAGYQHLRRELEEGAREDGVLRLEGCNTREDPGSTAFSLVVHVAHGADVDPIHDVGRGVSAR